MVKRVSPFRWLFFILLLVGVGCAALLYFYKEDDGLARNDAARVIPEELLRDLVCLSSVQLASLPVVDGFESPCGTTQAAFVYDAQGFGEQNEKRGGLHSGQDLNGIGGQNTDEGMPIYASARGQVIYAGEPSKNWGNVVVVAHRLPDGRFLQSLYAHLERIDVLAGQRVARGEQLGSMGTAQGLYWAHLHFEIIESLVVEAGQPAYKAASTMNRLSPQKVLADYPAPACADVYISLRRARLLEFANPSTPTAMPEGVIPVNTHQFLPKSSSP